MTIILKSIPLSFSVFVRMIFPVILISVASMLVSVILNIVTLGLAGYISGPVTAVFISLFGIRVALAIKGDLRRTDLTTLALNSLLYGVFFMVALGGLAVFANIVAVLFSLWTLGEPISLTALRDAAEPIKISFAFLAVGVKVVLAYILLAVAYAVMAVPMASAARGSGQGAPSKGFFNGFGRSFIPLFCVFFVSIFLQFFFDVLTSLFAIFPLILSVVSLVLTQSLPSFDLETILKGIASGAALLWLNSWIWSVAALALLKFDGNETPRAPVSSPETETATDIRGLRKSRERSF
ncbi:hypothetical protein [uncultured Ruegeria sp.]|uniref:hypothetical protein n=1 Tax=uncultured Ruegeria sp. TaxID=259304 RepID=UPI002616128E|nr:hypothetical protein [uncultured Ruegeria sp.]